MNYFIEGIPGSGKTTLLKKLKEELPQYSFYFEGDYSPIELAWNAYLTEEELKNIITNYPNLENEISKNTYKEDDNYVLSYTKIKTSDSSFYSLCEKYEIYSGRKSIEEFKSIIFKRLEYLTDHNVFECSFFQNIIDELLLYKNFDDQMLISFYEELKSHLHNKPYLIIRLIPEDIHSSLIKIKEERINKNGEQVWYHMMNDYIRQSPFGYDKDITILEYLTLRIKKETMIINKLFCSHYKELVSKKYDIKKVID